MGIWNDIKQKRKSKRDEKILNLYRDWPPDLVDKFLEWEQARIGDRDYFSPAPKGYISWGVWKKSYEEYKQNPKEGVVLQRRV